MELFVGRCRDVATRRDGLLGVSGAIFSYPRGWSSAIEDDVVDESGRAYSNGQAYQGGAVDGAQFFQGVAVGDAHVVNGRGGGLTDVAAHGPADCLGVALAVAVPFLGQAESARENEGLTALVGAQVNVAAAERQTVGLAHGRQADDLDGHIEVRNHAPNDAQLLGILLAEVADIGLDDVEELADHGGDAAEVAGAVLAFETSGDRPDIDEAAEARRVDLRRVG